MPNMQLDVSLDLISPFSEVCDVVSPKNVIDLISYPMAVMVVVMSLVPVHSCAPNLQQRFDQNICGQSDIACGHLHLVEILG
jgi:hypothetical protein